MFELLAGLLLLEMFDASAAPTPVTPPIQPPSPPQRYIFYVLFELSLDNRKEALGARLMTSRDRRSIAEGRVMYPEDYDSEEYLEEVDRIEAEISPSELEKHELDTLLDAHLGPELMRAAAGDLQDALHSENENRRSEDWTQICNLGSKVTTTWIGNVDELGGDTYVLGVKLCVDLDVPDVPHFPGWEPTDHTLVGLTNLMTELLGFMWDARIIVGMVVLGVDGPGLPIWDARFNEEEDAYIEGLELLGQSLEDLASEWDEERGLEYNDRINNLWRRDQWLELMAQNDRWGGWIERGTC